MLALLGHYNHSPVLPLTKLANPTKPTFRVRERDSRPASAEVSSERRENPYGSFHTGFSSARPREQPPVPTECVAPVRTPGPWRAAANALVSPTPPLLGAPLAGWRRIGRACVPFATGTNVAANGARRVDTGDSDRPP